MCDKACQTDDRLGLPSRLEVAMLGTHDETPMKEGDKPVATVAADKDVQVVLKSKGVEAEFPLFTRIHEIAFEGKSPSTIVEL